MACQADELVACSHEMDTAFQRIDLSWYRNVNPPCLRPLWQFAEEEIVIPDGPYRGRRFRCTTQPYARLWFDAIDSGNWQRFAATGPSQTGKTLSCAVIPLMYHLFEYGETVIFGVPDMEMAYDKWQQDLEPAIAASRFRDLIPTTGRGSRGGTFQSITFRNGATLRFMAGGGDDKNRAGFTSRILVITEVDGFTSGEASVEADKIKQMEARTRAYGNRRRIYLECTVSTDEGKIWQEYLNGTHSKIVLPCPHCGAHVQPEREHFLGWQSAENELQAGEHAAFYCPEDGCGQAWTEQQRAEANRNAKLIHNGQHVDPDGVVTGDPPKTRTLGFRWSAVHNLFATADQLGAEEWRASREIDQENAERERQQFVWVVPHKPDLQHMAALSIDALLVRQGPYERNILPNDLQLITVGVDVGKYLLHTTTKAWSSLPLGYTIDYDVHPVHSRELGEDTAILVALRQLREKLMAGWSHGGMQKTPTVVLIDSGNWSEIVYKFVQESGRPFFASKGFGMTVYARGNYSRPAGLGQKVKFIGDQFHVTQLENGVQLVEYDADGWKSRTHSRLECDMKEPGAVVLFKAAESAPGARDARRHLQYAKHLTAERKVEEFVPGKGLQTRWEKIRKDNHWLDTESMANLAGECAGVKVVKIQDQPPAPKPREEPAAGFVRKPSSGIRKLHR